MTLSRRSLITGLVSFVAAPAIVRAASIMPVKAWVPIMPLGTPDMAQLEIAQWLDEMKRRLIETMAFPSDILRPAGMSTAERLLGQSGFRIACSNGNQRVEV